jgi:hypothetical protein
MNEDFLNSVSGVPDHIGDEPVAPPAPQPVAGLAPPPDPMRPWTAIDVAAYVPMVRWGIKRGFKYGADKFDPLWETDDEELESIDAPLTEVVQKCLYDLRLSRVAGNPYVAFLTALGGLVGVKYAAIKVARLLEAEAKQRGLDVRVGRGRSSPIPSSPTPSPSPQQQPIRSRGADRYDPPNPPSTLAASPMASGRTAESGAASSSAVSPTPANRGSSSIEYESVDE